jgi:hypothetical protein
MWFRGCVTLVRDRGSREKGVSVSLGMATIYRWSWIAVVIPLAALALLVLEAPPRAAAAEMADASCAGPPNFFETNIGTTRYAQTFTAQNSGTLTSAGLEVDAPSGSTAGDWVVDILDTTAGVPVDGPLATDTVPDTTTPGAGGFITATFATPASVVAGHVYALEFSRPASTMTGVGARTLDACPGQLFAAPAAPSAFSASGETGHDMVFSITVNVPATPPGTTPPGTTPGLLTTGQRAAAKKHCKEKFRGKAKAKQRKKCLKKAKRLPV